MAPVPSRPLVAGPISCSPGLILVAEQCIEMTYEMAKQGTSNWTLAQSLNLFAQQHPVGSTAVAVGVLALIFHRELLDRWRSRNPTKSPEEVRAELVASLKARYPQLQTAKTRIDNIKVRVAKVAEELNATLVEELTRKLPYIKDEQLEKAYQQCVLAQTLLRCMGDAHNSFCKDVSSTTT